MADEEIYFLYRISHYQTLYLNKGVKKNHLYLKFVQNP